MSNEEDKKEKTPNGANLKGAQVWKLRSKHGRDKIFKTPQDLQEAFYEFLAMMETQKYQGAPLPLTIERMLTFLGITKGTLYQYRNRSEYSDVIEYIENTIFSYNFELASLGVYNSTLMARYLNIVEKKELKIESNSEKLEELTDEQLNKLIEVEETEDEEKEQ